MKLFKIFSHIVVAATVAMPAFVITGCSDDEEDSLDQIFDITDAVNVKLNEEFDIVSLAADGELLVVPADIIKLNYEIENTNIVSYSNNDDHDFKAVGIGQTTINIINKDNKLIKSINVKVEPPYKFVEGNTINLHYGESTSIFAPDQEIDRALCNFYTVSFSGDDIVNLTGGAWSYNGYEIRAKAIGTCTMTIKLVGDEVEKVYTINVTPHYAKTLTAGTSVSLSSIVGEENASKTWTANNSKIVNINNGMVTALVPGTTLITSGNLCLQFTSAPVTGFTAFPADIFIPDSYPYSSSSTVKSKMSAYKLESETSETYQYRNYTVLRYAPVGSAKAVLYYLDQWDRLKYIFIETGAPSEKVFGYMLCNYEYVNGYSSGIYFKLKNSYTKIQMKNSGSWSDLKIEY